MADDDTFDERNMAEVVAHSSDEIKQIYADYKLELDDPYTPGHEGRVGKLRHLLKNKLEGEKWMKEGREALAKQAAQAESAKPAE